MENNDLITKSSDQVRWRELGSIEVGKRADLLLLKDDPLASISAYDSIEIIFLNGEPIPREALRARD